MRHALLCGSCEERIWPHNSNQSVYNPDSNMAHQTPVDIEMPLEISSEKDVSVMSISTETIPGLSESENSTSLSIPTCLLKSMPRIYKAMLRPLDISFGHVREKDETIDVRHASQQVVRRAIVEAPKAKASICFVVKRPGCILCYEQGAALSELLAEFSENQVAAWAVVKEVVDPEGVLNLYEKYFKFPFFLDAKRALYTALGERRIQLFSMDIFKIGMLKKRCKDKGIEGNTSGKGESMILGGVIVFDRLGNIRYAHQEQFAHELPVDEIRAAIRQVVDEETLNK